MIFHFSQRYLESFYYNFFPLKVENILGRASDSEGVASSSSQRTLDFGLYVFSNEANLRALHRSPENEKQQHVLRHDTFLLGSEGRVFSPQEMFGLGPGDSQTGGGEEKDCIVCLTEQKEVLLLPCRYTI